MIGTIQRFSTTLGSGLAFIHINGVPIPISSGFGLRVVAEAFGSLDNAIGREIDYDTDALGVLNSFTPIEEVG